jgi:hypothetical protein
MRRLRITLIIGGALAIAGCPTKDNARFCNGVDRQCDPKSSTPFCDTVKMECVTTPPDMAVNLDMAIDMGEIDLAGIDQGIDAGPVTDGGGGVDANVDLKPMCSTAADCTNAALPICGTNGTCRACAAAADDGQCAMHAAGKLCLTEGTNAGQCGDCRPADNTSSPEPTADAGATTPNHCPSSAPVCSAAGACRGCQSHSECTSGICRTDGACVASDEISYVDVANGSCVNNGAGAGSMAKPYCQIDNAIDDVANFRNFYIVKPGTYAKVTVANTARDQTFVGPGLGLADAQSVIISPGGNEGILLSADASNQINLAFDGIIVRGVTGSNVGINISGGSDKTKTVLRLLRSAVTGGADIGISMSNATIFMDRDVVETNAKGGISLSATNFTIANSLIRGNGTPGTGGASTFGGITVASIVTTATLANLTIVNNTEADAAVTGAGISCALNTVLTNSVLFGNTPSDVSQCTTTTTAYVGATGATNVSLTSCVAADIFQSDTNFHILTTPNADAGNKSSCLLVDKGATPSATLKVPAHDLDGISRPQRSAWDIGAYEAP